MKNRAVFSILAVYCIFLLAGRQAQAQVELVLPSVTNPAIHQHDDANVIIANGQGDRVPIVLYLSGTHGRPQHSLPLLQIIAEQGYRVIGLSYDDEPSVSKVCPRNPDANCAANFRAARTFGDTQGPVSNPRAEAIVPRLIVLLHYLDREHPDAGWGTYLRVDGQPEWSRFVVSGHSQGAGMAAFIAKRYAVARVVLFSSPWDTTGSDDHPSPWLSDRSATPADRWWAERHAKEKTTKLIANAYAALEIPSKHILIFDKTPAPGSKLSGSNPFHGETTHDMQYADEWRQMFGHPAN